MNQGYDTIDDACCAAYAELGAVCLRGVFADWIDTLREGVERNLAEPGPYFAENVVAGDGGRFWDDYCNWERIPEFRRFVTESEAARLAAEIMRSVEARFFHDHVLVKEPGTAKPTPWHQDAPYYFVDGNNASVSGCRWTRYRRAKPCAWSPARTAGRGWCCPSNGSTTRIFTRNTATAT